MKSVLKVFVFVIYSYWVSATIADESCTDPNGKRGVCKPITECEILEDVYNRTLTPLTADILRRYHCGLTVNDNLPKVCCPRENSLGKYGLPKPTPFTEIQSVPTSPLLSECGIGNLQQNIFGGNKTDIDEFPWMVLLEYRNKATGHIELSCGGILINNRYVLTAAHCVKWRKDDMKGKSELVSLRLGEYDTSLERDCKYDPYNDGSDGDCADPILHIDVEKTIPHEEYDPEDPNQYNDIALLRLKKKVDKFTDFIRPICIPQTLDALRQIEKLTTNTTNPGVIGGWGQTENSTRSNIKLKANVYFKDFSECFATYKSAKITLKEGQLCAGGQRGIDSCRGDSGGPLMAYIVGEDKNPIWHIIGITSFGPTTCGLEGWPGIYTRISRYIEWIVQNLEP